MKVSEYIVKELERLGVQRVYTLCGGFSQYLNDAIGHSSLMPIYMLHESGAAFATCAEANYTGGISVICVTSGPGSTNALTGVASAWDDGLPVLFISGEANNKNIDKREKYQLRQGGPQDVPIVDIVKPITKFATTLGTANYLVKIMFKEAIRRALDGRRGPVWVAVPLDVQAMEMK